MNISAVINTKNSAKTLKETLESVKWADEIVVVDMQSRDETKNIAAKFTDKVFDFKDTGFVEPGRNFAIFKTTGDWILIVDADEVVPKSLRDKLRSLEDKDVVAYELPRKNIIFGKWIRHTGWWPDYNTRFFKKGAVEWSDEIHSVPKVEGKIASLPAKERYALVHHHHGSIEEYIKRMNRYTSIAAGQKQTQDAELDNRPLPKIFFDELFRRYFSEKGFMDKTHGLHLSMLQSMYQALTYLKKWEQDQFNELPQMKDEDWRQIVRDLNYWLADKKVRESSSLIHTLAWKIRRKLSI